MGYISVDVESDGPCPGPYSMICFGAVDVSNPSNTFYGKVKPISEKWIPDALDISGFNRKQHESFLDPIYVMKEFGEWINKTISGKPVFISDNPAFDWQWINYYFHVYYGSNPFGFSARRIGDLYCGLVKHAGKNNDWKRQYRKTSHTHNPVDDAMGNAEAIIAFRDKLGLKIQF